MCNHYRIENPQAVLDFAKTKAETLELPWAIRSDAWPRDQMPVLYQAEKRSLTSMRWGVWPFYDKGKPKGGFRSNARNDQLLKLSMWKHSAKRNRCLVPADAWLEWTGPKGAMWEVLFRFRDSRPFWVAGLWSNDPEGGERGFALVTGDPNPLIASVPHERMIVLLHDSAADRWIGNQPLPDDELLGLCAPYPDTDLVRVDLPKPLKKSQKIAPVTDEPNLELGLGE